jgi:hypothetical protein
MMWGFADYLRERFRPQVFGPAILGLTGLAIWSVESAPSAIPVTRALVMSGLLILQFRLWDDLEDRDRDRQSHPERVLVRLAPRPFWWALIALGATNLCTVMMVGTPVSLMGLVGFDLAALIAYRLVRGAVSDLAWAYLILLAKYPVFVLIVALATGPVVWHRLTLAALCAYAVAQLYERVHTRASVTGDLR